MALTFIGWGRREKGTVIVRVGKSVLTVEELNESIPLEYTGRLSPEQKIEMAKAWLNTELVYQDALKNGIQRGKEVKKRVKEMERQIIVNEYLSRYMKGKGYVSDKDVRDYFDKNENEYNTEVKIAQILVATEEEANMILDSLKSGKSFAYMARKYSLDSNTSTRGGVIGYIRKGDRPALPEFEDAAYSLRKIGDVSSVTKTVYGYHILKLLGRRKLRNPVKFEDVENDIRNSLTSLRQREIVSKLVLELRGKAGVEEHYEVLK